MKGRGEIITILCMSVFFICILYAMTYGGIVKAEELEKQPEEAGEKTEVDIEEELRWAEEVKKILKDIVSWLLTDYHFKQSDMIPEIVDAEGKTTPCFAAKEAYAGEWGYLKK